MKTFIVSVIGVCVTIQGAALSGCAPGADGTDAGSRRGLAEATSRSQIVGLGGKCVDDNGNGTANGNKIQLWDCNGTGAQKWAYTNGTLVGPGGKCLDINQDNQVAGTLVQLWDCNGTEAQTWAIQGKTLVSTKGLCLDATGNSSANGTQLELWSCNGGANQSWQLATTPTSGPTTTGGTPPTTGGTPPTMGGNQPPPNNPPPMNATGRSFYVSESGNDSNDGLSTSTPLGTIGAAAWKTQAGDTVYVMNGTYGADSTSSNVLYINQEGTPNAYITYQAYPGHHPVIQLSPNNYGGIMIQGGSYIIIDGFEVRGMNQSITQGTVDAHRGDTSYAPMNENCISGDNGTGKVPHHIIIRNNITHDCSAGGIDLNHIDYLTIENNTVYNNAWYSSYGGSGTDIWEPVDVDANTGYKIIIQNNTYYNNYETVPTSSGMITDGNGILIDDNLDTQNGPHVAYHGRTLVQNNVAFNNGGVGIGSYMSAHIDFINNTSYGNGVREPYGPQMGSNACDDIKYYNNIMYAMSGQSESDATNVTNLAWDYNLQFGGNGPAMKGAHDLFVDPRLVSPSEDPSVANFALQTGSPAIGAGTSQGAPSSDRVGTPRPSGAGVDIGAYQYKGN